MNFVIRWPDGSREACYSPSLVICDHLQVGETYPLDDFVSRSTFALGDASQRVEEKYGSPCSLALGQAERIRRHAKRFCDDPNAVVVVENFE